MRSSRSENNSRKAAWFAVIVFIILLAAPIAFGVFFYDNAQTLSQNAITNRETLVGITAAAVNVRLNRLVNIATTMMTDPNVVKEAGEGKWTDAAGVLRDLQNNVDFYDPYIDRVVLFNTSGTEVSAYPELAGGIGANFATAAWYQALQQGAPSYLSTVSKRTSLPQLDVVSVAVPIKNGDTVLGYGTLQIRATNFLEFGSDVSLGTFGFAFIVDQKGNIVAHPRYSSGNEDIVNVATVPVVAQVIAGNSGVDESFSPADDETVVSTYTPVPNYGWGVIVQEPYNEIFSASNSIYAAMQSAITLSLLIDLCVAYIIFKVIHHRHEK